MGDMGARAIMHGNNGSFVAAKWWFNGGSMVAIYGRALCLSLIGGLSERVSVFFNQ